MWDAGGVGIDLMLGLLPFDEDLVTHATQARLDDNTTVPVASPEHLVVMKAVAWRPKDLQDIREIVLVNTDLNWKKAVTTFTEYAELLEVPERVVELEKMIRESQ
jgi:hypothetical protein